MNQNALAGETAVAQMLSVKAKTLQAWRSRGGGPPFLKIGRLVKYDPESVMAWIRSRERTSTSPRAAPR